MYDGHVFRPQHLVDGLLLRLVQIGEVHGCKREDLRLHPRSVEQVAQVGQPALGPHHTVEGIKHHLVARLVEEKLDAHLPCSLHVNELSVVRHGHHHLVAVDIADGSRKVEVSDLPLLVDAEEGHRPAELEVMLYLVILALTVHLHDELVQRVIVAFAHPHGIPGIAALHLPLQPRCLGLLAKGLLLSGILHLEQQPLLLQCQYRRSLLISHNCVQRYE